MFHLILFCISFTKSFCSVLLTDQENIVTAQCLESSWTSILVEKILHFLIMKMKLHSVRCIISASNGGITFCILVSKILIM